MAATEANKETTRARHPGLKRPFKVATAFTLFAI